jgi:hypothetical protein
MSREQQDRYQDHLALDRGERFISFSRERAQNGEQFTTQKYIMELHGMAWHGMDVNLNSRDTYHDAVKSEE